MVNGSDDLFADIVVVNDDGLMVFENLCSWLAVDHYNHSVIGGGGASRRKNLS